MRPVTLTPPPPTHRNCGAQPGVLCVSALRGRTVGNKCVALKLMNFFALCTTVIGEAERIE